MKFFKKKEKIEKLENGQLPWGWITRNKDFTDDLQEKNKYFMNLWLNSRKGNQKEQIEGLKSFILFLEDSKALCESKGECHLKWFQDIIADDDYINKRKMELEGLQK